MNVDTTIRTPYNTLAISLVYRSIDRKVERDQFCVECGHPFLSISDKVIAIYDGSIRTELLRTGQRIIGVRCKHHYCKQRYKVEM